MASELSANEDANGSNVVVVVVPMLSFSNGLPKRGEWLRDEPPAASAFAKTDDEEVADDEAEPPPPLLLGPAMLAFDAPKNPREACAADRLPNENGISLLLPGRSRAGVGAPDVAARWCQGESIGGGTAPTPPPASALGRRKKGEAGGGARAAAALAALPLAGVSGTPAFDCRYLLNGVPIGSPDEEKERGGGGRSIVKGKDDDDDVAPPLGSGDIVLGREGAMWCLIGRAKSTSRARSYLVRWRRRSGPLRKDDVDRV